METSSVRRKACDLCFIKKIKCDMLKPACSNCVLYKAECKSTTVRRRAGPARERQQQQKPDAAGDPKRVAELESRLARIEEQLQHAMDANIRLASQVPAGSPVTAGSAESSMGGGRGSADGADVGNPLTSSSNSPSEWVVDPEKPKLPPLEEMLPVIEEFFNQYNVIMPLFDQKTFMRMVSDWYSPSSQQSPAVWAAINIVLALGYRCSLKEPGYVGSLADDQKVLYHMRNAQSAVSDLVTREEDLLGIQVLVGMIILFQGTKDPKPASVLIGTAIRLAHRMHLHDKESMSFFPPEVARQRSRVFWMAYIMDKDISLRSKTPSFQLDADIDLALPEAWPDDGAGIMAAKNGSKFNVFRARAELSHIAGKVYDLLYSTRSRKVSKQELESRMARLEGMLEKWKSNIPSEFGMESMLNHVEALAAVHMSLLYHNYFVVTIMTHGIYVHDAEWVQKIDSYSRTVMREVDEATTTTTTGRSEIRATLPDKWTKCVELSRGCMKLFNESPKTDCSIWTNSCAHFSGLIILVANMFVYPEHEHLTADQGLANQAMQLWDMMLELLDVEAFRKLHAVVSELYRRALATVEKVARKRKEQAAAAAAAAVAEAMSNSLPFGTQLEEDVMFFGGSDMGGFEGMFAEDGMGGSPVTIASDTADGIEGIRDDVGLAAVSIWYGHY
ncbi:fungal-specific transcription factor domain-containing protein [Colletotrichum sublineola]|uniref:Putative fungal specific transcription factor domain-containing protein n=1 Tax=Colletotrichum sublineola TaxID=1173701 RepID=A0A066WWA5_COLSU|nr:fungal-specific transcription factor domain-containing protein [Colletotrichum sublineola]KDN60987.1 putative fungal specific transcription factor domain-containing protein [Colletotrichum sublineola]